MRVTRKEILETASSAVHALAVAGGLSENNLPMEDGYIIAHFGDYGEYDMGITIFDQDSKLAYLATESYYMNGMNTDLSDFYMWESVCKAVCKHTGAKGVKLVGTQDPSLDHQVIPYYGFKFCSDCDEDSIINFIFNPNIGIDMRHD